jgi:hypothetical protein
MDFVSVETPPSGVSVSAKVKKFFDYARWVVFTSIVADLVADDLIKACAVGVCLPARLLNQAVIDC